MPSKRPDRDSTSQILVECDECQGTGKVPMVCVNCGVELTAADLAAYPEAEACTACCRKEETEELAGRGY